MKPGVDDVRGYYAAAQPGRDRGYRRVADTDLAAASPPSSANQHSQSSRSPSNTSLAVLHRPYPVA